ncbi:MAG: pilus assembly protein TadG-related protein [Thermoguttaceae bacterium]
MAGNRKTKESTRRGAIAVLAMVFLVVALGMVAFVVDVGYLALTRTRLQAAADSAALAGAATINLPRAEMEAEAKAMASANMSGQPVLSSSDIEYGVWDAGTYTFAASNSAANAVRVTVRTNANNGGATPLFFARIFGLTSVDQSATAIATVNPRDICFVVDLSASMNYDTRPDRADSSAAQALIQKVYSDFGFGAYPGTSQYAGYPLTKQTSGSNWLTPLKSALTSTTYKNTIYFTGTYKNSRYYDSDGRTVLSDATRTRRAYAWVMDVQIGQQLMPAATPKPNSTNSNSYNYWKSYIDDPDSASEGSTNFYTRLGYASYVQFMMYNGRDGEPDNVNTTPMSVNNALCPYHSEPTDGGTFNFPPQEQPTHAARRAMIAALQVVKDRNSNISDPNQKDWVSIVTFDKNSTSTILVTQPLTVDYSGTMAIATTMQACGSGPACTCTEGGLVAAYNHIKPQSQGGKGREHVNKIVVLLTDGAPNLRQSSSTTINNYKGANPSDYWIANCSTETDYCKQASLMEASIMQGKNWYLYPVGLGLDVATDFMDKMALMSVTADKNGNSFSSTDPASHEATLKKIFETIITRPKLRLVQ